MIMCVRNKHGPEQILPPSTFQNMLKQKIILATLKHCNDLNTRSSKPATIGCLSNDKDDKDDDNNDNVKNNYWFYQQDNSSVLHHASQYISLTFIARL